MIDGLTASNCTLSSFDTHDTGRDIVFSNCVSVGAGDDGFQFRTNGVRAIGCTAVHSTVDGFSDNTGVTNTVLIGCKADWNGRAGVNFVGPAELTDCEITNNTNNTVAGVVLQKGGRVTGGRITGNYAALRIFDAPLLVRGIYAPADTVQTVFCTAVSGLGGRYNKVQLRDNEIPGYAINTIFARQVAARPAGDLPPITSGNRLTADIAGAEQNGEVTLVAGTATVSTTAVKRATGANWSEDVISKIELRRVSPGGTVGNLYVESVTHQSGFTVRSTNAADTSKVRWTVEL